MAMDKTAVCEILVTSDIHGHIYPTDYRTAEERNLGLAKIASLIRRERRHHSPACSTPRSLDEAHRFAA